VDLVQSNSLAAKAKLISDKQLLFDAVPFFLSPFCGSARELKRAG
jgi:hypothetical protein